MHKNNQTFTTKITERSRNQPTSVTHAVMWPDDMHVTNQITRNLKHETWPVCFIIIIITVSGSCWWWWWSLRKAQDSFRLTFIHFPFHSSNKLNLHHHHHHQFLGFMFTQNHCIGVFLSVSLMKRCSSLNQIWTNVFCVNGPHSCWCVCVCVWRIMGNSPAALFGFMIQKTRTNIIYIRCHLMPASLTHTHTHRERA